MAVTKQTDVNKSSGRSVLRYNYFKKLQEMFVNQENSLSTVDTY